MSLNSAEKIYSPTLSQQFKIDGVPHIKDQAPSSGIKSTTHGFLLLLLLSSPIKR